MNEIELKTKIEGLEKAIKEHDDFSQVYQSDLAKYEQELKDYNKPELTPKQLDDVQEAIEDAVGTYSFDNVDDYDVEFCLDYDGRVTLDNIGLSDTYDLVEKIVKAVHNLFKEADCPEELDTTEPDNHPVEKLQQ